MCRLEKSSTVRKPRKIKAFRRFRWHNDSNSYMISSQALMTASILFRVSFRSMCRTDILYHTEIFFAIAFFKKTIIFLSEQSGRSDRPSRNCFLYIYCFGFFYPESGAGIARHSPVAPRRETCTAYFYSVGLAVPLELL